MAYCFLVDEGRTKQGGSDEQRRASGTEVREDDDCQTAGHHQAEDT